MPVSYRCNEADRTIIWTTTDPVALQDWQAAFDQSQNDPLVHRLRPVGMIVDMRDRNRFNHAQAVRTLATSVHDRVARLGVRRMPVAIVVSSAVAHGMARIAEAYVSEDLNVQIFRCIEAARTWVCLADVPVAGI